MNRIIYGLLFVVALFAVASCSNPANGPARTGQLKPLYHTPVSTDYFRINMQIKWSASYPTTPTPPPGGWWDVSNWQYFLKVNEHATELVSSTYPSNNFDMPTQQATVDFQNSTPYGTLPPTGKVDAKTYAKALAAGMTPSTPVQSLMANHKHHSHGNVMPTSTPSKKTNN